MLGARNALGMDGSAAPATPKLATLVDDFATKDTSKWLWFGTAADTAGQLILNPGTTPLSTGYTDRLQSGTDLVYDLAGSEFVVNLAAPPLVGGGGAAEAVIQIAPDLQVQNGSLSLSVDNYVGWDVDQTPNMYAIYRSGGVQTTAATLAYSSTTHKFFRIRESLGTIYWDWSTDGLAWTNFTSAAVGWASKWAGRVRVQLAAGPYVGGTSVSQNAALDNVNNPAVPWVARTQLKALGSTTAQTINFTPATAGNLLVAVCTGPVTFTTPTGWTLPTGGSAVSSNGLYVFTKTAGAGESSFASTNNSGNTNQLGIVVYEFPAGTTLSVAAGAASTTPSPALSGLSGTNTLFAVASRDLLSSATGTMSWSGVTGVVTDVDQLQPSSNGNNLLYSVAYLPASTATSFSPSITTSGQTTAATDTEWVAFALASGAESHTGSGSLSGSGSLTPGTAIPAPVQSAALAGSGTLAPTSTLPNPQVTPALAGSGTLAPTTAVANPQVTPALAGSGTLTPTTAVANPEASPAFAGSGALTPGTGTPALAQTPALSGSGALVGTQQAIAVIATAALGGSGTTTATQQAMTAAGTATQVGTGTLGQIVATPAFAGDGALDGSGTVTGSGTPALSAQGDLTGAGSVTGSGIPAITGSGTLAGDGGIAGSGAPAIPVAPALSGSGTLAGSGAPSIGLAGDGALTAGGTPAVPVAIDLSGAGSLAAAASSIAASGGAALAGAGDLLPIGSPALSAVATGTGDGVLSVIAGPGMRVELTGDGALDASAGLATTGSGGPTGDGSLAAAGAYGGFGLGNSHGLGALSTVAVVALVAAAELAALGTLVAAGNAPGSAALAGTGTLAVPVRGVAAPYWIDAPFDPVQLAARLVPPIPLAAVVSRDLIARQG